MRVDCARMDEVLDREQGGALTGDAQRHLAECARCRRLRDSLAGASGSTAPLSPALRQRITGDLAASLRPVQPLPSTGVSVLQMAGLLVVLAAALTTFLGTAGVRHMDGLQVLVMSALLAAGACLFSLSLAWQMRPGARQRWRAPALLAVFAVGLLTGMALLFQWRPAQAFVAQGWPCAAGGLIMAVPAGAMLWLVVRRGAPLARGTLGATIGAASGLLGVTVLQFRCPLQEASHLLVWHGGVLLMAAGAGLLIARRVLPPPVS